MKGYGWVEQDFGVISKDVILYREGWGGLEYTQMVISNIQEGYRD